MDQWIENGPILSIPQVQGSLQLWYTSPLIWTELYPQDIVGTGPGHAGGAVERRNSPIYLQMVLTEVTVVTATNVVSILATVATTIFVSADPRTLPWRRASRNRPRSFSNGSPSYSAWPPISKLPCMRVTQLTRKCLSPWLGRVLRQQTNVMPDSAVRQTRRVPRYQHQCIGRGFFTGTFSVQRVMARHCLKWGFYGRSWCVTAVEPIGSKINGVSNFESRSMMPP